MMKILFLFSGVLLFAFRGTAQSESPVVVVTAQGNVRYVSETGATLEPVPAGAVLKKSGTLHLPADGAALLQCNGRLQPLQGPSENRLSTVFPDKRGLVRLNFDTDFSKYIQSAVDLSASKTGADGWGDSKKTGDGWGDAKKTSDGWGDSKKTGDGWGDSKKTGDGWGDSKKTGDGWGGQGARIILILPGGNLREGTVANFSWSRPADASAFKLDIMDGDNRVLYTVTVKDTFAPVDLRALNLTVEEKYYWKVSVPDAANVASEPGDFTIQSEQVYAVSAQKVVNSKIYRSAEPPLKRLMEAVALEKAGWYYDANEYYSDLLKNYPADQMTRLLYAAFWMRGGLEPKAKAVISK
ncbi:MAG: hypothetical protein IPM81_10330 [Saprospirales bacterium]|nr:hypothetical protein [Saprospirales bacterium]